MKATTLWITMLAMVCVAGLMSSCKDDAVVDSEKPTITMAEPSPNDTISVGTNEIHIEFVARDNDKLQQLTVTLSSPTNASLYTISPNVANQQSHSFHEHVMPTATEVTQLTLTIVATDAHGNKETRIVVFYMAP